MESHKIMAKSRSTAEAQICLQVRYTGIHRQRPATRTHGGNGMFLEFFFVNSNLLNNQHLMTVFDNKRPFLSRS